MMVQLSIFEQKQEQAPGVMGDGRLPSNWAHAPISEVASLIRGVTYEKSDATTQHRDGSIPVLRATNIQAERLETEHDLVFVPQRYVKFEQMLKPGDIVICMSSGSKHLVGKTAQLSSEWRGTFGAFCAVARFTSTVNHRFAGYFFASPRYREFIRSKSSGVNINNLRHGDISALSFPIPPTAEQERIVAAIEEQFTRLDAGVAALKRAQANLKRYKAAVLKAACEGALVPQDPNDEPADALLARILAARRAKWEADLRAKGKNPATARYDAPAAPNTDDLPALPDGWCWATLDQLASDEPRSITDGPFGSNLKTSHYTDEGPRVIRLQNIGDGEFRDEYAHISAAHFETLRKHQILAGDLAIAGLGETLPRACVIPDSIGPAIVKADCIRFKPHAALTSSKYLNAILNSEPVRKIAARIVHGVGRPRMNQGEIRSLPAPLPPLAEQERIVAEVERRLSVVQEQETVIAHSLTRAERLRQAILAQAFAGRLVPQDPADEPASALLARIRATRTGALASHRASVRRTR